MQQPTRLISTPFAQEGEKTEIQNVTGEFDNSATYRLGFPPLTMQSIRSGGKPPKGTDFNGVLFDITENISFLCKGGRYQYNAGLSTSIGGYPEGSNLLLDDNVTEVVSTVAGNQNNPNTNMAGWILKPNKTTAVNVADASGETQQQVNYNGGAKWHSRVGGYLENERVVLANGDIVKSTIDGNANNPNSDMAGWVYSSLTPSNNLSDVADEAEARTNLGVYSKAETDAIAGGTPDATETVAGKAKIATTAIAQAGTNDTDIITALKLKQSFTSQHGDTGWEKLPDGLIIQWGLAAVGATTPFPIAFPTACYQVAVSYSSSSGGGMVFQHQSITATRTGVTMYSGGVPNSYIAIGR